MSESDETSNAAAQLARISRKTAAARNRLNVLLKNEQGPGASDDVLDQAIRLEGQLIKVQEDLNASSEPIQHVLNARAQAKQREQQIQSLRAQLRHAPPEQKAHFDEQISATQKALDQARNILSSQDITEVNSAITRMGEIDKQLNPLIGQITDLWQSATTERSLAEAGVESVEFVGQQFSDARNYHRDLAWWMLVGLALTSLAGAGLIYFTFFNVQQNLDLPHLLFLAGGRVAILAAFAWLLSFFGRLHARHAEQAVLYQDRLAGLDVATGIIQYSERDERRQALRMLADSCMVTRANSFKDEPKKVGLTTRDIARLSRVVERILPRLPPAEKK